MKYSFIEAFESRTDLKKYQSNALLLFSLQLRFLIEDIDTIASVSLTDGGEDDKKCDLIYIERDSGYAVIAQAYYSQDSSKPLAKVNKARDLNTAASWLLTRDPNELPKQLQPGALELQSAIRENKIRSLQFWYSHNLPENKKIKDELLTVQNTAKSALDKYFPGCDVFEVSAIEVGTQTLEEWYKNLTIPILITDKLQVKVPGGYTISEGDWSAFVTAVPAEWLYELFKTYKSDLLFSANVRGYLGSRDAEGNINNGIKKTATEDPERFWVYNNGLTGLVHNFNYNDKTQELTITGLSIVNGAQTTGAIGSITSKPSEKVQVHARFVACQNRETVKNVIKFNNSQNRIEAADFRSNDSIQHRLVEEFKEIPNAKYLGGRRGGDEDMIKRVPSLLPSDTVAQALAAFHQDSVIAYNEKTKIWVSDNLYSRYFSERTSARHIVCSYSLLRAVEKAKSNLLFTKEITDSQRIQLEFLRSRGATYLLASAIASCIEVLAGKAIPDKFKVSFGKSISPENAEAIWEPIVAVTTPFVNQLAPAAERGLKNADLAKEKISLFRSLVEATKIANIEIFKKFSGYLVVD